MYVLILCFILVSAYGFNPNRNGNLIKFDYKNKPHNPNNINDKVTVNDVDYEIPNWVYKKVFKFNKPTTKIKEKDYYNLFRSNPKL